MEFFDFSYLEKAIEEDTAERKVKERRETNRRHYHKNIEKSREYRREKAKKNYHKNIEKSRARHKEYYYNRKKTPIQQLMILINGAKKNDKKKNRQCDLDEKWAKENAKITHCPYCAIEFTQVVGNGISPHNRSIHRIDNKIGHTKENSIVICCMDNLSINKFGEDTYEKQSRKIAERTARFTKSLVFLKNPDVSLGGSKGGYGACLILP